MSYTDALQSEMASRVRCALSYGYSTNPTSGELRVWGIFSRQGIAQVSCIPEKNQKPRRTSLRTWDKERLRPCWILLSRNLAVRHGADVTQHRQGGGDVFP